VNHAFEGIVDRFVFASSRFEQVLAMVQPDQWDLATPCTEWNVRQLSNHQTRANLNFAALAEGGSKEEFIALRDVDALGDSPVDAFKESATRCATAFAKPGALRAVLDYPLGKVTGDQALALRTTDSVIHTWDLARAIGADEQLDAGLVSWVVGNLDAVGAGLPEMPTSAETTNRFFAPPIVNDPTKERSVQYELLLRTGRQP
jgi:uncharacterized protein (TIGR03086 family)